MSCSEFIPEVSLRSLFSSVAFKDAAQPRQALQFWADPQGESGNPYPASFNKAGWQWADAPMGSLPEAVPGPSWPACWHKEHGGEKINLEDNLGSVFPRTSHRPLF